METGFVLIQLFPVIGPWLVMSAVTGTRKFIFTWFEAHSGINIVQCDRLLCVGWEKVQRMFWTSFFYVGKILDHHWDDCEYYYMTSVIKESWRLKMMLHSQGNQENIFLYKEKHGFEMVFSFTYGSCSEKQWSFVSLKVFSKTPGRIVLVLLTDCVFCCVWGWMSFSRLGSFK